MTLELVTGPSGNIVSNSEIWDELRVDLVGSPAEPADASVISFLRDAAEQLLDGPAGVLGRALLTQTWKLYLDEFPCGGTYRPGKGWVDKGAIHVPLPPIQSVSSITYVDTAGATQTLASSVYQVVNRQRQGSMIVEAYGQSWPSTRDIPQAVAVTFVAGYGAASAVPAPIRQAIRASVVHWYENRGVVEIGRAVNTLPWAADMLVSQYRTGLVA